MSGPFLSLYTSIDAHKYNPRNCTHRKSRRSDGKALNRTPSKFCPDDETHGHHQLDVRQKRATRKIYIPAENQSISQRMKEKEKKQVYAELAYALCGYMLRCWLYKSGSWPPIQIA
jgi:hypothetical protein